MPTDEDRRALYAAAETAFGARAANTLMELLPPVNWADVATRRDVEGLGSQLHREMADMRTELKGEMSDLRIELKGEMSDLRIELKGEMSELKGEMSELKGEIGGLKGEMALMESRIVRASIYGSITVAGIALAAAGVGIAAVTAL